jgi:hypothetical protein
VTSIFFPAERPTKVRRLIKIDERVSFLSMLKTTFEDILKT